MKRKGKPCNTDPERARKRAATDLRCAVRKLGFPDALRAMASQMRSVGAWPLIADELDRRADQLAEARRQAEGVA